MVLLVNGAVDVVAVWHSHKTYVGVTVGVTVTQDMRERRRSDVQ